MDESKEMQIRKIEDIIDIQKANGNIRQVAFKLPIKTDNNISDSLAKSLETGLSTVKIKYGKKKDRKLRSKNRKHFTSDVISWPSDSDVTVLRMKICSKKDMKDNMGNIVLGDGLHHPDSSSMVNLATLILQTRTPSKQNMNVEEYLLPLSSWEHSRDSEVRYTRSENVLKFDENKSCTTGFSRKEDEFLESNTKSRLARFLRLYFCPCCICLYNLENMQKNTSAYFNER